MYETLDVMKFRRNDDPVAVALEDAGISADVARRLATAGTPLHVKPGVSLCREGDFGREAFVLVRGEAVVRYDGKKRTVAAGEVFGELAALDPKRRRNATVETTEASMVLAFDVRTFRALAADHAEVLVPDRAA
jgi:CRP-like cAMP-binding protein